MSADINFLPNVTHGDSAEPSVKKPVPVPLIYTTPEVATTSKSSDDDKIESVKKVLDNLPHKATELKSLDSASQSLTNNNPKSESVNNTIRPLDTLPLDPATNKIPEHINSSTANTLPKTLLLNDKTVSSEHQPLPNTNSWNGLAKPTSPRRVITPTPKEQADSLEVNLIPTIDQADHTNLFSWPSLVVATGVAILIIMGGYMWLRLQPVGGSARIAQLTAESITVQEQLDAAGKISEDLLAIDRRLKFLGNIAKARVVWAPVFKLIENSILQNVSYSSIVADVNGNIIITAEAPTLTEVGRQLKSLQTTTGVTAVILGGLELKSDETNPKLSSFTFTLTITITPDILALVFKSS